MTIFTKYKKFIKLIEIKMMKNMEIDDEDIPDEFLDPIMSTLIKNPMVILKNTSSGIFNRILCKNKRKYLF